jgi:cob(I)alamin adenosyltransferase
VADRTSKPKVVPTKGPALATRKAPSIVMVNTGDGKGKSTAAFGTAMRAVARGWKVCVIQFVKSGKWKVGEEKTATSLGIEWLTIGDGFTWDSKNMDRSEAMARHAWSVSKEKIQSGQYGLVVLDEITYPMSWGWIPTSEVVDVIRNRPPSVNVIATGREAPAELVDLADTVTEMRKVKHAFDRGVRAIRGIDF